MELSVQQQIADYIGRANKILIALPVHTTVDRFCSAYALNAVLKKLGKESTLTSTAALPELDFLSEAPEVVSSPSSGSQSLEISVSTINAELDELSYQTESDRVQIFLKSKNGQFAPEDVSIKAASGVSYDLIITLGAHSLEDLGDVYQNNADLFFSTPKINLDVDAANEYFGAINLVEVTASSLTEIVSQIIESLDSTTVDENIATSLLAGIISSTHSFQDPATTPKTLSLASSLIAKGARQQDIIKSLYKTKDFSLLKLWGRALARIKTVPESSLLYSLLTLSDFERTGYDSQESQASMLSVMRELLENVTGFQTVALVAEQDGAVPGRVRMLLAGLPHANITAVAHKLTEANIIAIPLTGLYQAVTIDFSQTTLAEAEQRLIDAVRAK